MVHVWRGITNICCIEHWEGRGRAKEGQSRDLLPSGNPSFQGRTSLIYCISRTREFWYKCISGFIPYVKLCSSVSSYTSFLYDLSSLLGGCIGRVVVGCDAATPVNLIHSQRCRCHSLFCAIFALQKREAYSNAIDQPSTQYYVGQPC